MAKRRNTVRRRRRAPRRNRLGIRAELRGKILRPRSDPKATVYQPWWPMTLSFQSNFSGSSEAGYFTFSSLKTVFRQQLDLPAEIDPAKFESILQFRIQSVRIWEITGAHVYGTFYQLVDTANTNIQKIRANVDDEAGRNHWSKVGYLWPNEDRNMIFEHVPSDLNGKPIFRATTETDGQLIVHMNILWRFKINEPTLTATDWVARQKQKRIERELVRDDVLDCDSSRSELESESEIGE